ncbi:MAG: ABC transporter permease [Bacteroidetes bacterium]|nr:MAG: ABC transporter permease [Bacteroidota bacterium]
MGTILKIIREAVMQAFQQLNGNKLRSFLSLLGISIGIFSIIGVLSAVDSLEDNVKGSLDKLGDDVVYVTKWPWADTGGDWWKYLKRPEPTFSDYEVIKEKVHLAETASYALNIGFRTIKHQSSSVDGSFLAAISLEYGEMTGLGLEKGRYFSPSEYNRGANKILLGNDIATNLFGPIEPIGREVKIDGRKFEVIGVIEKSGEALINIMDYDEAMLITYPTAAKMVNVKSTHHFGSNISVKAKEGVALEDLKDEIKGVVRANHRLKPRSDDDFSLNQMSMLASMLDNFFVVLNILGIVIGIFSFLIGGVSVANIMFVSVKERTSIIGVKKALGAKKRIILLEFLIESTILCIIGGIIGMFIIQAATMILTNVLEFELYMDMGNILLGLGASIFVGIISGFVPALQAANMDPVEAMRK